jgi:hypothetical protein
MTNLTARQQIEGLWSRAVPIGPLLDQFEADARALGMREAAAMLRAYCPEHGDKDTGFMDCHCPAADEIDRDAARTAPTR